MENFCGVISEKKNIEKSFTYFLTFNDLEAIINNLQDDVENYEAILLRQAEEFCQSDFIIFQNQEEIANLTSKFDDISEILSKTEKELDTISKEINQLEDEVGRAERISDSKSMCNVDKERFDMYSYLNKTFYFMNFGNKIMDEFKEESKAFHESYKESFPLIDSLNSQFESLQDLECKLNKIHNLLGDNKALFVHITNNVTNL